MDLPLLYNSVVSLILKIMNTDLLESVTSVFWQDMAQFYFENHISMLWLGEQETA